MEFIGVILNKLSTIVKESYWNIGKFSLFYNYNTSTTEGSKQGQRKRLKLHIINKGP